MTTMKLSLVAVVALATVFPGGGSVNPFLEGDCVCLVNEGTLCGPVTSTTDTDATVSMRLIRATFPVASLVSASDSTSCDSPICPQELTLNSSKCTAPINGDYSGHAKKKAQVGDVCVYSLDHTLSFANAKKYCEDNGLMLVDLQDSQKQKMVAEATGYNQHWMNLEKVSGSWIWGGAGGKAMTNARWENAPSDTQSLAITMTTLNQNKYFWKGVDDGAEYRPVCEGPATGCPIAVSLGCRTTFGESVSSGQPDDRCVYGVDDNMKYDAAKAFCHNKGTKLVWTDSQAFLDKVNQATGLHMYWVGLELIPPWTWIAQDSSDNRNAVSDISGLWKGQNDPGNNANAVVHQDKLKGQPAQSSKRVVCEGEPSEGPSARTCLCINALSVTGFSLSGSPQTLERFKCYAATGNVFKGSVLGQQASLTFYEVEVGSDLLWVSSLAVDAGLSTSCSSSSSGGGGNGNPSNSDTCPISFTQSVNSGVLNGRCVYGTSDKLKFAAARSLCEDKGLRLVWVETTSIADQVRQLTAMDEFWVGLQKTSGGIWTWVESGNSEDATSDVAGRWQGSNDATNFENAVVKKSNLKGLPATASKNAVCEGNAGTCMCINTNAPVAFSRSFNIPMPVVLSNSLCMTATGRELNGDVFNQNVNFRFFELERPGSSSVWVLSSSVDVGLRSSCSSTSNINNDDCVCTSFSTLGAVVHGSTVTLTTYAANTCFRTTGRVVSGDLYQRTGLQLLELNVATGKKLYFDVNAIQKQSDQSNCPCRDQSVYSNSPMCSKVFRQPIPGAAITYAKIGGRCVYGIGVERSYSNAKSFCEENGLRLVHAEDNDIAGKLGQATGLTAFWIGLEKNGNGGWEWVDGNTRVNAAGDIAGRWANGEPSSTNAYLNSNSALATRDDVNRPFVCEEIVPCSAGPRSVAELMIAVCGVVLAIFFSAK